MKEIENNLIGKVFGRLTVIDCKVGKNGGVRCDCKCECGNEKKDIPLGDLISRHDTSCGCARTKYKEDLTGKTINYLTVIGVGEPRIGKNGYKQKRWACKCECGNIINVEPARLVNGTVKSCGCKTNEIISKTLKKYNKYEFFEDYVIGYTSNHNLPFYVDLDDYEKIKDVCWIDFTRGGMTVLLGTTVKTDSGTKAGVPMHRFLGYKNYDHIDRNELNNRKSNLRPCTALENSRNKSLLKSNKSGVAGVWWDPKRSKWEVSIVIKRIKKHLGRFDDKEEATIARLKAEKEYFGEFAPQRHLFAQYGI